MNLSKSLLAYLMVKQAAVATRVFSKEKGQPTAATTPGAATPGAVAKGKSTMGKPNTGVNANTIPGANAPGSSAPGGIGGGIGAAMGAAAGGMGGKGPATSPTANPGIKPINDPGEASVQAANRSGIMRGSHGSTTHANGINAPATGNIFHQMNSQGNITGSTLVSQYGKGSSTFSPNNPTGIRKNMQGQIASITDGGKPWKPPAAGENGGQFAQRMAGNAPGVIPPAAAGATAPTAAPKPAAAPAPAAAAAAAPKPAAAPAPAAAAAAAPKPAAAPAPAAAAAAAPKPAAPPTVANAGVAASLPASNPAFGTPAAGI